MQYDDYGQPDFIYYVRVQYPSGGGYFDAPIHGAESTWQANEMGQAMYGSNCTGCCGTRSNPAYKGW